MKFRLFVAFLLTLPLVSVANVEAVKAKVAEKFPKLKIEQVKETPVKGMYEVLAGGNIVYLSEDSRYLISGEMRDLETNENLTEVTLGGVRKTALKAFSKDEMITFPAEGKQKDEIYVFTDVTCPYCSKLHNEVPALNKAGVTVNYLLYPRGPEGSKIYQLSHDIWCAKDRKDAIDKAKKDKDYPKEKGTCKTPIAKVHAIGEQFGVSGTPYIVLGDGQSLPGFVPAARLLKSMGL